MTTIIYGWAFFANLRITSGHVVYVVKCYTHVRSFPGMNWHSLHVSGIVLHQLGYLIYALVSHWHLVLARISWDILRGEQMANWLQIWSAGHCWKTHTVITGEHALLHECSAYNIQVKIRLSIEKGDKLTVCTHYEVPAPVSNVNSVYLCRHERLENSLKASQNTNHRSCTYCNTHITKLSNYSNVPGSITVQTTRYLGRGEWPFSNYDEKLCLRARSTRDVPF